VLAIRARTGLSLRGVLNCGGSSKFRRGLERLGDDRLWLLFRAGLICRLDTLKIMLLISIVVQIYKLFNNIKFTEKYHTYLRRGLILRARSSLNFVWLGRVSSTCGGGDLERIWAVPFSTDIVVLRLISKFGSVTGCFRFISGVCSSGHVLIWRMYLLSNFYRFLPVGHHLMHFLLPSSGAKRQPCKHRLVIRLVVELRRFDPPSFANMAAVINWFFIARAKFLYKIGYYCDILNILDCDMISLISHLPKSRSSGDAGMQSFISAIWRDPSSDGSVVVSDLET